MDNFGGLTGISVPPSATSGAKGSWVSLGTLKRDCSCFMLKLIYKNNGQADTACSVDIAIGPGQTPLLSNVGMCLQPPVGQADAFQHMIPLRLAAGTQVWVRSAINVASFSGAILAWMTTYEGSFIPWGGFTASETLGFVSAGRGTLVTPGAGAAGAWSLIGTPSRDWVGFMCWQDIHGNASNETATLLDFSLTPSNSIVLPRLRIYIGGGMSPQDFEYISLPVPAGVPLYVRAYDTTGSAANTCGMTIYGFY